MGTRKFLRNLHKCRSISCEYKKFLYTDYSLNDIVKSSVSRAIELVEKNGGHKQANMLFVAKQNAVNAKLQQTNFHHRVKEQISYEDSRWQWFGDWHNTTQKIWLYSYDSNVSENADAEARITFEGTGAALTGILLAQGGKADIYLDGEFTSTIDTYSDEESDKPREALWHDLNLHEGEHSLRIVVRGEPYAGSMGTKISISSLIVYH